MKITRRDFMKVAGVVGAAAALAGCSGMAPGAETATSTAASTAASAAGSVAAATGSMELSGPIQLTFAAQEVGTAAYNYAAALQSVMLPELPAGSTIDITTTSPGGVGAPVIVNAGEECDLVMSNAGPAKWSYEKSTSEYEFGGCTEIACLAGGLGQNFINIMFTQKFVNATGYKTFEEVVADKYPVKMVIKKNGSFGEQTAEKVCEALGITFDDIESWGGKVEKTGGDAIKSGLQDDLYDMTIDHIGKGQSNTTELCLTHDMYDVELNEDTRNKLCEMGYTPVTVEAGTWNKQDRRQHGCRRGLHPDQGYLREQGGSGHRCCFSGVLRPDHRRRFWLHRLPPAPGCQGLLRGNGLRLRLISRPAFRITRS